MWNLTGALGSLIAAEMRDVFYWPITTDIVLNPDVGFRGTADIVRSGYRLDR